MPHDLVSRPFGTKHPIQQLLDGPEEQALAERYGWDVLLEDIRRLLKCQQCGRPADRLMLGHEQAATPEG